MTDMNEISGVALGLISPIHALCLTENLSDLYAAKLYKAIAEFNREFCVANRLKVEVIPAENRFYLHLLNQ